MVSTVKSKENGNQEPFEKMIIMNYPILAVSKISLQRYEFLTELQGEDYTNRDGYKFLCSKINLWVDFVKKFVYLQSISQV